jgi:hypothetical protein
VTIVCHAPVSSSTSTARVSLRSWHSGSPFAPKSVVKNVKIPIAPHAAHRVRLRVVVVVVVVVVVRRVRRVRRVGVLSVTIGFVARRALTSRRLRAPTRRATM